MSGKGAVDVCRDGGGGASAAGASGGGGGGWAERIRRAQRRRLRRHQDLRDSARQSLMESQTRAPTRPRPRSYAHRPTSRGARSESLRERADPSSGLVASSPISASKSKRESSEGSNPRPSGVGTQGKRSWQALL